jgi:GWxTD domain-containing protein
MRCGKHILFSLVLSSGLLIGVHALAQGQPAPQDTSSAPLSKKESKKRDKKLLRELGSGPLGPWLNDVIYIITKEERDAFLRLSTNEEREQFIESFWDRRNPDPESETNSFKDEYYRRIAYANEHFSSGIPGWKTDRGHIYILWGPPDEIEAHPTGGTYDRTMQEGGGSTTTYPWEKWRYRHMEGVGENIEIEFVDASGSGEYHITMDPGEKDALAHVPGAGPSLSEILNPSLRAQRFSNTNGTTLPAPIGGMGINEFDNLEQFYKVQQPPRFKDLQEFVTVRVVRDQLPLECRTDFLRVTSDSVMVPITVQIANRSLGFEDKGGVQSATLNLYAQISTATGRVVQRFEDAISKDVPESLFAKALNLSSIYQKAVPLRPGLYMLDVVVKDVRSGNVGTIRTALRVPRYDDEKLEASSLILADEIQPMPTSRVGLGPFVIGSYKVRPRVNGEFLTGDRMGAFLQLYNLKTDAQTHKNSVVIEYRVMRDKQEIWKAEETAEQLHQNSEEITLQKAVPLTGLAPGRYVMEIKVTDRSSGQTLERAEDFTVKEKAERKPIAVANRFDL